MMCWTTSSDLRYAVGAAEGVRNRRNEHGAQLDAEHDSDVAQGPARTGDHDICHRVSKISCTFGSGGRKLCKIPTIWCSFAGSVPKRPSKYQRKRRPGARVKRN